MDRKDFTTWATTIAIVAVVLNVAFYFLSDSYYADKAAKDLANAGLAAAKTLSLEASLTSARKGFAFFSIVVSVALIAVPLAPRALAYSYSAVLALGAFAGAIGGFKAGFNTLLPVTLLLMGGLLITLSYFAAARRARGAWAFLVSLVVVLAVCTLFGVTKIRDSVGIGLYYALIVSGLSTVTAVALTWIRDDFTE